MVSLLCRESHPDPLGLSLIPADGHIKLGEHTINMIDVMLIRARQVERSFVQNEITVLSIFVNPAQFAPHEDLSAYPRTFNADMERLSQIVGRNSSDLSAPKCTLFLPTITDMYPSGIAQDMKDQKGTFVQVKGYEDQMEGKSRPTFFRGVATVSQDFHRNGRSLVNAAAFFARSLQSSLM